MKSMSLLIHMALCVTCLTNTQTLNADVYKWVDEDGRVHYGDKPSGNQATEIDIKPSSSQPARSEDWKTIQQRQKKYLEYLEDERKDRDEIKAKQAAEKAERQRLCTEATEYHQKLLSNRLWYREDKDGNKVYLDYKEKDEEIRKTKEMMDKFCIQ